MDSQAEEEVIAKYENTLIFLRENMAYLKCIELVNRNPAEVVDFGYLSKIG